MNIEDVERIHTLVHQIKMLRQVENSIEQGRARATSILCFYKDERHGVDIKKQGYLTFFEFAHGRQGEELTEHRVAVHPRIILDIVNTQIKEIEAELREHGVMV